MPKLADRHEKQNLQIVRLLRCLLLQIINEGKYTEKNSWIKLIDNPTQRSGQGFTFEQVCMDHSQNIKKALGIGGNQSHDASWRRKTEHKAAQIDLLIDPRDHIIII